MLIINAGERTIDISSYVVSKETPLQVEELFLPNCQMTHPWFSVWLTHSYKACYREENSLQQGRERWSQAGSNITRPPYFLLNHKPENLKGSMFNTPEDIAAVVQAFDEGAKRIFSDDTGVQYVKFGSVRDNDPKHGIRSGKLVLTG